MVICVFKSNTSFFEFPLIFYCFVYLWDRVTVQFIDTIDFRSIFLCDVAICCVIVHQQDNCKGIFRAISRRIIQFIMEPYSYKINCLRGTRSILRFSYVRCGTQLRYDTFWALEVCWQSGRVATQALIVSLHVIALEDSQ